MSRGMMRRHLLLALAFALMLIVVALVVTLAAVGLAVFNPNLALLVEFGLCAAITLYEKKGK